MSCNARKALKLNYLRIPESQLRLERKKRVFNKTWHQNIINLLLGKNVCGSCLRFEHDLVHLDAVFVLCSREDELGEERSLRNIMISTFGPHVVNIIPTKQLCQKCVDIILSAHLFIQELRSNCKHIETRLIEIFQQMKWTQQLDESGSWNENINIKVIDDDEILRKINNSLFHVNIQNNVEKLETVGKMHKIVLNNESLKSKLLKEPDMHKFLIEKDILPPDDFTEDKLPAGITVKKVTKNTDIPDFAPHDLLELNWAEDDPIKPDTPVSDSKLHSNEALIMNLMEQAKSVEKQIHFNENLNLKVNKNTQVALAKENYNICNDSLSVKLLQKSTTNQNDMCSDNDEIVPQDLLELKWPEEQSYDSTLTKIPLKKLNFNEALTVKFIPSHKLHRDQDNTSEIAPHELLELNWNEQIETQNDDLPPEQTDHKHNIDLTQWLQDQGLSTIRTEMFTENKRNNLNDTEPDTCNMVNINQPSVAMHGTSDNDPINDLIECNIIFKQSVSLPLSNESTIRCALCDLRFIQFESYQSHYKTHKVVETAKCYRCPSMFPVIELLIEHLLLMHSEDMAYCTLCYALLDQDKLARHMVDHHAKKVEIINAPLSTQKPVETHCKKCNESLINSINNSHICVFRLDCTECKGECVHKKYISSYIMQLKSKRKQFQCIDCEYQYKTKQDIIRHANYAHLKHKSHQCKLCHAIFSLHADLVNHNDMQHFRCKGCRKIFLDKIHLDKHSCPKELPDDEKKNIKELKCEFCGQNFMSLKCYQQHTQTASIVSDKCIICDRTVSDKCNLTRHMLLVHHLWLRTDKNVTMYECSQCQTECKNQLHFTQHNCLYVCAICTKRFNVKILYDKHMQQVHSAVKCQLCNLQLVDKYAFANHMVSTHTDHEQCAVCLRYIKNDLVEQHFASHVVDDKLKCPHCNLDCENQNQFEVHVNRFHLLNRPYQCDLCKKCFYGKQKLRAHVRQHYSQTRTEKCTFCGKKFARKVTLEKHMKLHTIRGQLFDCDLCEKRYISPGLLTRHRKTHKKNSDVSMPKTSHN